MKEKILRNIKTLLIVSCLILPQTLQSFNKGMKDIEMLNSRIDQMIKNTSNNNHQTADYKIKYSFFNIGETKITSAILEQDNSRFNIVKANSEIREEEGSNFNSNEVFIYDKEGLNLYKAIIEENGEDLKIYIKRKDGKLIVHLVEGSKVDTLKFDCANFDCTSASLYNFPLQKELWNPKEIKILNLEDFKIYKASIKKGIKNLKHNGKRYKCNTINCRYGKKSKLFFYPIQKNLRLPLKIEEKDEEGKIRSKISSLKIDGKIV